MSESTQAALPAPVICTNPNGHCRYADGVCISCGDGAGRTWVVKFDHRADGGARLVGPFGTKADATTWLHRQTFDYEANCTPLDPPTQAATRPEVSP